MMKKAIVTLLFIGAGLGVGLGMGMNNNDQVLAHEHANDGHHAALIVENRSTLEICVQSFVPDEADDKAREKVEKVLNEEIMKKNKWKKLFGNLNVNVKSGCDVKPYLMQDGNSHPILSGSDDPGRIVEEANSSMYTIFVVPDKVIDKHFKGVDNRTAPEELLCEDGVCQEVTKGVYMTLNEFKNKNRLEKVLSEAFVLEIIREDESKLPENRDK